MELGRVLAVREIETTLDIRCGRGKLRLDFLGEGVVKVRAGKELAEERSWVVKPKSKGVKPYITQDKEKLGAREGNVELVIYKRDSRMELWADGKKVFGTLALNFGPDEFSILNEMPPDEHYFGFGEKAGRFDKRGAHLVMRNRDPYTYNRATDPLYLSITFFLALRKGVAYGFFLDNPHESCFDMGAGSGDLRISSKGNGLSEVVYYLIFGPSPADVVRKYTGLTGRAPLPPLWALGYHQSRWSYQSEAEVLEIAREFRRKQIPCDAIHLDIHYMDGYRCFTWHPKRFSNPERMIKELGNLGMRVVAVIDPGMKADPKFWVYADGVRKDCFVKRKDGSLFVGYVWPGKCVFPDFTRPEVRMWWAGLHQSLLDKGVAGVWNDMNEPTYNLFAPSFPPALQLLGNILQPVLERIFPVKTNDVAFYDGGKNTPFDGVRNAYATLEARATGDAFTSFAKGKRPFILSRSGFAGIQRHAAVWTGDNISTWDHLNLSIEMLLNLGLSGVAFVGADIGGFAPLALRKPFLARCSPELYARWIQVGIFYPFCRTHSSNLSGRREPWAFGRRVEEIARRYIELRYRLLPYVYSLFWEHTQNGLPMMRAMFLHYPNDENCYRGDQFLFGPSVLVAPVCEKGATEREVYLPEGEWYDYWTGEKRKGKARLIAEAPLERIPIFIKAGAIIPTWPPMNFVGERPINRVTLEVYPGNGEFLWYEDDGESLEGDFALRRITAGIRENELEIQINQREGNYSPEKRELAVLGKWVKPHRVRIDGKAVPYLESAEGAEVSIEDDGKRHIIAFELF
ncbi:glycoside hydrolase family 31 protein [Dehalococcoidia bacterium]|nr:glycoside hydrolase family 31 protein [Dehalococcoidia bacterium]